MQVFKSALIFNIAIKPKSKERPRAAGVKVNKLGKIVPRFITPAKTLNWEYEFKLLIIDQINKNKLQKQIDYIFLLPIKLKIIFSIKGDKKNINLPHQCTPDIDNLLKTILDSLNGLIYKDDKQVYEIECKKIISCENNVYLEINTFTPYA
jgi:Holliday junction resolvase RusA-like endonuclease